MDSPSHYPDGPLDQIIDVSHLSERSKLIKRNTYTRWTVPEGELTTAAGKTIKFDLGRDENLVKVSQLAWKVDGQVSVASISCQKCAEINSCREEGTPPFVCLVRAGGYRRPDGTSQCAYCFCNSFGGCQAKCGEYNISDPDSSESEDCEEDENKGERSPQRKRKLRRMTRRVIRKQGYRSSSSSGSASSSEESVIEAPPTSDSVNDESNRRYSHSGRELQPVKRFTLVKHVKKKRRASATSAKTTTPASQTSNVSSANVSIPVIMVGRRGHSLASASTCRNESSSRTLDDGAPLSAISSNTMYTDGAIDVAEATPKSYIPPLDGSVELGGDMSNAALKQAQEEYEKAAEEVLALKRAKYQAMLKGKAG